MTTQKIKVTPDLTLVGPDGQPVDISNVRLEYTTDDSRLIEYRIVFEVTEAQYAVVDAAALFHLETHMRGPVFAGGFQPGPIEIEARLNDELLSYAHIMSSDVYDAGALLIDDDGETLRHTESWHALYVMQQRGPVKTGFRTLWR